MVGFDRSLGAFALVECLEDWRRWGGTARCPLADVGPSARRPAGPEKSGFVAQIQSGQVWRLIARRGIRDRDRRVVEDRNAECRDLADLGL